MIHLGRFNGRTFFLLILLILLFITAVIYKREDHYGIPQRLNVPKISLPGLPTFSSGGKEDTTKFVPSPIDPSNVEDAINDAQTEPHIIDELLRRADKEFTQLLAKETNGLHDAAEAYRTRRGRQPPPRFDEWYKFAMDKDAVMIEDLFDQIYDDINPFWALKPSTMKASVDAWPCVVSVRNGVSSQRQDEDRIWVKLWHDMVHQIAKYLPDVDIAINEMDESRLLVPWEAINHYMETARNNKENNPFPLEKDLQVAEYPTREKPTFDPKKYDYEFTQTAPYWSLAREACAPITPAREASAFFDMFESPKFAAGWPNGTTEGYVSNWTWAKDPCMHYQIRGLHGSFIEPISLKTSQKLFPLFGGSKLPQNNDILIPAAMYWSDDEFYQGGDIHVDWEEKTDKLIWRGTASGGRNKLRTWARFQRHRFVSMMNGTHIRAAQVMQAHESAPDVYPPLGSDIWMYTWPLPDPALYNVSAFEDGHLGGWLDSYADAAFTHLFCFPNEGYGPHCPYTDPFYEVKSHLHMKDQYYYKYLPDLDGNSFSGRYRAFLRSNSLPLKATVYSEWHDNRLIPWKHFVPLDNTYKDFWGVMDYFLGYDPAQFADQEREIGWTEPSATALDDEEEEGEEEVAKQNASPLDAGRPAGPPPAAAPAPAQAAPPAQDPDAPGAEDRVAEADDPFRRLRRQAPSSIPKRKSLGHDAAARHIAESGHKWAERVLRKEDMLVYMYRLLLEYARVLSEDRDRMGWTGDGGGVVGDVVKAHEPAAAPAPAPGKVSRPQRAAVEVGMGPGAKRWSGSGSGSGIAGRKGWFG